MKTTILILTIILSSFYVNAQSFSLELDHSTIQVKDIVITAEFYKTILQLKELDTPWPDNPMIRFFEIGNNQQLHIAQVDFGEVKLNKAIHIAFAVKNFDGYLKYLNNKGIEYSNFKGESKKVQLRPDGVHQIYFQDPDGYWIEINDANH